MNESEFFEPSDAPVDGPLAGLAVVEATTTLAGPMIRTGAPALGAHTDEILGELGFDTDRIAGLRSAQII